MNSNRKKKNIKVHFVYEPMSDASVALDMAKVKYRLYSCYKYIKNKKVDEDFRIKKANAIIKDINNNSQIIQDSGLFTMMFGADKNQKISPDAIAEWQVKMIKFVIQNNIKATIVENDCQKLIGTDYAWKFRKELKRSLPNNRIINVFHLEDGKKGLDKLIDFSDYIAISVPELRINRKGQFKQDVYNLTRYIKTKKPDIDIHLLGCTDLGMIRDNSFCTSCDSSSWLSFVRYGFLKSMHIELVKKDVSEIIMNRAENEFLKRNMHIKGKRLNRTKNNYISAMYHKSMYEKAVGGQE